MDNCPICLCQVGKRKYKTACGHCFHYKCIFKWIMYNDTCPICRRMVRHPIDPIGDVIDLQISEEEIDRVREIINIITDIINNGRRQLEELQNQ